MENNVYLGATDWASIFRGAADTGTEYLRLRAERQRAEAERAAAEAERLRRQGAAPGTPMSQTTKTILIVGGIVLAGALIYSITKKK